MITQKQKGFTLIELIVAIGIFSVMLLVISSAFTHFVRSERREIAEQTMQEDLRLTLELFNKEARTAYGDTFDAIGSTLYFRNQNKTCVKYELDGWQIKRAEKVTPLDLSEACRNVVYAPAHSITDVATDIKELKFLVHPASRNADNIHLDEQGFITIALKAQAKNALTNTLIVQSSVTSRQQLVYLHP